MPDCDNQTCLQVLPHVPWVGGGIVPAENRWSIALMMDGYWQLLLSRHKNWNSIEITDSVL